MSLFDGDFGVFVEALSNIDMLVVVYGGLAASFAAAALYVLTLDRSAQEAAMLAFPQRKRIIKTWVGRQALSIFTSPTTTPEHLLGQVDLDTFSVEQVAPNPVATGSLWARGAKRAVDMSASLLLVIFTAPVLLLTAALIKLESAGPVFYKQIRVGRNGQHFSIYKFRSMTVDAEKSGVQWAAGNDARVTRVGRFIRKTRIDEIPQAFNILKRDMSFVGPRPERPEFTEMLAAEIPHYNDRHLVKPGLTGWAQIRYPYGASVEDARQKLTYDLYYIKHFSFVLDLFIIIRTIKVAVKGIGSR